MIKLIDIMREMKVHSPKAYTDQKGLKQGVWVEYDENGNLMSRGSYKNGLQTGIWEHYYDNGQLQSKGPYKDDERDGIWEFYMENGDLNYKGLFKNNKFVKII